VLKFFLLNLQDFEEQAPNIAENQDTYTFDVATPVQGTSQSATGNSSETAHGNNTTSSTNRFEF